MQRGTIIYVDGDCYMVRLWPQTYKVVPADATRDVIEWMLPSEFRALKVGDSVKLTRNEHHDWPMSGRQWQIVRFVSRPVPLPDSRHPSRKEKDAMAMSKDRVKFYLGSKYLQHSSIFDVLYRAFNLTKVDIVNRTRGSAMEGLYIVCRPSQFARFMIYRNEVGIQNGFIDLQAKLVDAEDEDIYTKLARATGVDRSAVKKVVLAIAYEPEDLEDAVMRCSPYRVPVIDVASNPHNHC